MLTEHSPQQIVDRFFAVTDKQIRTPNEMLAVYHELQTLFLALLIPYYAHIDNFDILIKRDAVGPDISLLAFLSQCINRVVQHGGHGLSFFEASEAYFTVGNDQTAQDISPVLNFTHKKVLLATLQTIHMVLTKNAAVVLASSLSESKNNNSQRLAREIHESGTIDISNGKKAIRLQSIDTALGAANDGISHVVAVIDALWSSRPDLTIEELFPPTKQAIVRLMTAYASWRVQLLDVLILADVNPYTFNKQKLAIEEKPVVAKVVSLFDRTERKVANLRKEAKRDDISAWILKSFGSEVHLDKEVEELAQVLLRTLELLLPHTSGAIAMEHAKILSNQDHESTRALLVASTDISRRDRVVLERAKVPLFLRALAVAQVPGKILSALEQRSIDNQSQAPRCTLLNVPDGLNNWFESIRNATLQLVEYHRSNSHHS